VRILVLGGTGFIGGAFVERAVADGHFVRVLSRHVPAGETKAASTSIDYMSGDFCDMEILERAATDMDLCLHAASTTVPATSNRFMEKDVAENLIGSIRILQTCLRSSVKRVVFISSGGTVYGLPVKLPIMESDATEPISAHGIVKLSIEKYLALYGKLYGLDYRIARLSNPYGPKQRAVSGQGVVAAFVEKALKGEPLLVMGDGTIVRDFIYIDDAIEALHRLCTYAGPYRIFNVGSGVGTSVNAIIASIAAEMESVPRAEYQETRKFDVPSNILSCDLARRELKWHAATTFAAGLRATIDARRVELVRKITDVAARPSDH